MAELVVFSSLFPSAARPGAGIFIRERMFRVAQHRSLVVVSPQPWFPGQFLIRWWRPGYRPPAPTFEIQQNIQIYRPRFFSIPGLLRRWDGWAMALASYRLLRRLKNDGVRLIDAHFAYPDGEAATRLGRWLDLPTTITLRGTEVPHSKNPILRPRLARALQTATRVFSVSNSLRQLAIELGVAEAKTEVIGNGVDITRFHPIARDVARRRYKVPLDAQILISVGGLVERKGMHRVIACLPELIKLHPDLHYLIVGGGSAEGNMRAELDAQVASLGLTERVHFLGSVAPDKLKWPLSAADVFVLATRNEGWANVFLEAMACGLPVISTDVGGNTEVVCRPELGSIVPFDDEEALRQALDDALNKTWDRIAIIDYAHANQWDKRVAQLLRAFDAIFDAHVTHPEPAL